LLGIYLIVKTGRRNATDKVTGKGVALALIAAVLWAGGTTALKLGVTEMDSFVAAAIRITAAAVTLPGFVFTQWGWHRLQLIKYGARSVILVVSSGILSYGIAAVCYVTAVQLIGIGKTVLLTAAAPLFLLPMSVFILKEHPTSLALVGALVSVVGVCLIAL